MVATLRLPCEVAQKASRCRHSFIENTFLIFDDQALAAWLDDDREVREFTETARFVCGNVAGFSPVEAFPAIAPLAALPAAQLQQLREILGDAFERQFQPEAVTRRLRTGLETLLVEMNRRAAGDATPEQLRAIRDAAAALHMEMRRLPGGFWLPCPRRQE